MDPQQPRFRVYTFKSGKMPPVAAGFLVVGVGALLFALGLTLLAGVAVVGVVTGVGVLAYRAVRGRVDRALGRGEPITERLDPSKEVLPPTKQISGE
jgi:hypothetical protein